MRCVGCFVVVVFFGHHVLSFQVGNDFFSFMEYNLGFIVALFQVIIHSYFL